jgi:DNA-binding NarL/FixJ family response regulator
MTPWKRKIIFYRCDGLSYKEIASKLKLSPRTVEVHIREVYKELHVHNVAQLIRKIREEGK